MEMYQLEKLILKPVPKRVKERTLSSINNYCMSLGDAFKEAARMYAGKTTELGKAFYYDDYRAFIPSEYYPEYLDFTKYPLKYK